MSRRHYSILSPLLPAPVVPFLQVHVQSIMEAIQLLPLVPTVAIIQIQLPVVVDHSLEVLTLLVLLLVIVRLQQPLELILTPSPLPLELMVLSHPLEQPLKIMEKSRRILLLLWTAIIALIMF